jgi:hypothetical protein
LLSSGLDEAILGFGPDPTAQTEDDAQRVAALLAHGAHNLLEAGAAEEVHRGADQFQQEDIDTVCVGFGKWCNMVSV